MPRTCPAFFLPPVPSTRDPEVWHVTSALLQKLFSMLSGSPFALVCAMSICRWRTRPWSPLAWGVLSQHNNQVRVRQEKKNPARERKREGFDGSRYAECYLHQYCCNCSITCSEPHTRNTAIAAIMTFFWRSVSTPEYCLPRCDNRRPTGVRPRSEFPPPAQ